MIEIPTGPQTNPSDPNTTLSPTTESSVPSIGLRLDGTLDISVDGGPERPAFDPEGERASDAETIAEGFDDIGPIERPPHNACYIFDPSVTIVEDLPTALEIGELVAFLTRPYPRAALDTALPATWFTLFDAAQHATPLDSPRWCEPLEDAASAPRDEARILAEDACRVLGGGLAALLARVAQRDPSWPHWWGDPPLQRGTGQRLLERLHLRHDADGYRIGQWLDETLEEQPPPVTLIGLRHPENPWWALVSRSWLNPITGPLVSDLGLEGGPDAIALPLDGPRAASFGLFLGIDVGLPKASARRMSELGDALGRILEATVPGDLPSAVASILGATTDIIDPALTSFALSLPDLAVTGRPLALVGSDLLDAMAASATLAAIALGDGLGGPWFWLITSLTPKKFDVLSSVDKTLEEASDTRVRLADDLEALAVAVDPDSELPPMVLLGPTFRSHASAFGFYEMGSLPGSTDTEKGAPWAAYRALAAEAGPVLDAARMFDVAGMVAERLIEMDDSLLAIAGLSLGDGLVGIEFRRVLVEKGLPLISDALGGFRPAELARYVVRQVLTDQLVEGFRDRYRAACLYDLLCWTRSAAIRDRIDAALGPLVEIPLTDWLDPDDPVDRDLLDAAPFPSLWLRGSLLSSRDGALGRLVLTYLRSGGDIERFDETLDVCDLALLIDWMSDARLACLAGWLDNQQPPIEEEEIVGGPSPNAFWESVGQAQEEIEARLESLTLAPPDPTNIDWNPSRD